MKIAYRVSLYSTVSNAIKKVEILAEECGIVVIKGPDGKHHSEMIGSEFHCYRETFDEAKSVLMQRANEELAGHTMYAKHASIRIEALKGLTE